MNSIVDIDAYRENIISLWNECFGDDREYIEFFLDNCPNKCCVGYVENGQLYSMLFLLNGNVNKFSCKYIYAACTAENARGKGLMGGLIEFSKKYCSSENIDYIFLVPAEETLYSYYSRFGFIPKMQRCEIHLKADDGSFDFTPISDIKSVAQKRLRLLSNIDSVTFDRETTEYTVAEFLFSGGKIYSADGKDGFLAFAVDSDERAVIKELLTENEENLTNIFNLFEKLSTENIYIHTPIVYNSTDIRQNCTKCGMLYPVSNSAKENINQFEILYSGMYLD